MVKKIIKKRLPGLANWLNRVYNHLYHLRFYGRDKASVFSIIYQRNHWKDMETVSGPGSSLTNTRLVRSALPAILKKYKIRSMLDIPCGDFNWMNQVDLEAIQYIGMDIVPEIVKANVGKWASSNRKFEIGDITTSVLPDVDLIFCRDCFVHFSYSDIKKAIANIKKSNSSYILTTTFQNSSNFDIVTGNWRPVNLESPIFNLPKPLEIILEGENEYKDKSMALWMVHDLP